MADITFYRGDTHTEVITLMDPNGLNVRFINGTSGVHQLVEGETIEGVTGGATATVDNIVILSGTWAGTDAIGKLFLSNQTGTFQAENIKVGTDVIGQVANNSSVAFDLTGYTVIFTAKLNSSLVDTESVFWKTNIADLPSAQDITITDEVAGEISIAFEHSTLAYSGTEREITGSYVYDIQANIGIRDIKTVDTGTVGITQDITRSLE